MNTFTSENVFRSTTKAVFAVSLILFTQNAFPFYNPSTGRWLRRDPIKEQGGMNLYGFIRNAPLGTVDRLGLIGDPGPDPISSCPFCKCKSLELTFDPGGDHLQLGWYDSGGPLTLWKYGNKIQVKWRVLGNPLYCKYSQDERGSKLTAQEISPVTGTPEEKIGEYHFAAQEYEDYLGIAVPSGTKFKLSGTINIVLGCVSSQPFSDTITSTISQNIPPIVIDGDEPSDDD